MKLYLILPSLQYFVVCFSILFFWLQGVDVNRRLDDGRPPLHHAADFGQVEVARYLLLKGADVNVRPIQTIYLK